MLKILEKFIDGLGDFNHAFIGLIGMIIMSLLIPFLVYPLAIAFSFFYLGKEHWTYIRLGNLKSLNMMLWAPHDRNQTIYLWAAVWGYAVAYDQVLFTLI